MNKSYFKIDWLSVLLFFSLVFIGWISIYSTTVGGLDVSIFNLSSLFGKQLLWILLSLIIIVFLFSIECKFYERFSSVIYVVSILSLLGLLFFGKTINGQTAWYSFGSFSIQPAEFAKAAVSLAIAKYVSELNVDIKKTKYLINTFIILAIPIVLILMQPDAGSALVFFSFFIALYREGLPPFFLWSGVLSVILFALVLLFGSWITASIVLCIFISYIFLLIRKKKKILKTIWVGVLCLVFVFSVNTIYHHVLQEHQKDRFEVVLNPNKYLKGKGYNLYQSKVAIGSGGFSGKGFLNGTQKQGKFVPEQHTDYIFTSIAEEWGLVGCMFLIAIYISFLVRILTLAERQKKAFSRIYGYCVFGIVFLHFFVNIGMVTGILPTIGIPLPLLSYGGSGLWGFTILIFIFLKLDAERQNLGN